MVLIYLHDLGLLAIKQRAFDFVRALGSSNAHVDGSGEVAGLVGLDLFDLQIALFGDTRRINKVNAVLQYRVQKTLEEGSGECRVSVSARAPVYSTSMLLIGPSAR